MISGHGTPGLSAEDANTGTPYGGRVRTLRLSSLIGHDLPPPLAAFPNACSLHLKNASIVWKVVVNRVVLYTPQVGS